MTSGSTRPVDAVDRLFAENRVLRGHIDALIKAGMRLRAIYPSKGTDRTEEERQWDTAVTGLGGHEAA